MSKKEEVIGVKLIRLQIKDKTIDLTEADAKALRDCLDSLLGKCDWPHWVYPTVWYGSGATTISDYPQITWSDTTSASVTMK